MTVFLNDAHLLDYEPNLFAELPLAGQQRLALADAQIDGPTLTSPSGGFDALEPGQVVLLGQPPAALQPAPIDSIQNDNQLTLGQVPAGLDGPGELTAVVRTFLPQARLVHAELMRHLGLGDDQPEPDLDESSVLSLATARHIEALGTLWLAFQAAASCTGDNDYVQAKAEHYRLRYRAALHSAVLLLDTDGDGRADRQRRPGVLSLFRL